MNSKSGVRVLTFSVLLIIFLFLVVAFTGPPTAAQGRVIRPDSDTAAAADSKNVAFVGQIGGTNTAVAVAGSFAYLGEGPRLTIFDVSDKEDPVLVGRTAPLPDMVLGVKHAGNYVYVAAGYSGLRIIDVSNPSAPVEVGSFDTPSYVRDVAIDGNFAYLPDGGYGLRIIDISNHAAPVQVGITPATIVWTMDVAVAGGYAFVATEEPGLVIYDVSDPAAPAYAGAYGAPAEGLEVAVSDDTAYLTDAIGNLHVIDISAPATPTLRTNINLAGYGSGLTVDGSFLYIGDGNELRIFDVTNPDTPSEQGSYVSEVEIGGLDAAGDYVYLLDTGLHIIDASNKSIPTETDLYHMLGAVADVAISGDYTYLATEQNGLNILNTSNPSMPSLTGHAAISTSATGVTVGDTIAYVSSWSGLHIIDVSSPTAPIEIAQLATPDIALDVAVAGGVAYVADSGSGLRAIDVGNPSAPFERGFVAMPGSARAVALAGNYAFVAGGSAGLRIIDITNPSGLEEVGSLNTPDYAQDVTVVGNIVYLADESSGIHVIDVSNPGAPELIASFDTPGAAYGITIEGKHVYIGDGGNVRVVDACDQTTLAETGFYKTVGSARRIALDGSKAFVADENGGLLILQYTGPGSITIEKQADFVDNTSFNFGGDLGGFALKAGATKVFPEVSSADYDITENLPLGWYLDSVNCNSSHVAQIMDGVNIQLDNAEDITCTFNNRRLSVKANAGGPYAGDEGSPIVLDASASSNLAMINTYKWDCTNDGTWDVTASSPVGSSCTYPDNGAYTIKLRTGDIFGATASATTTVDVSNIPPQVNAGDDLTAVAGADVHFAGSFTDPGSDDTHTVKWNFGDGSQQPGTLTPMHSFSASGQYTVTLTVTDDDGGTGSDTLIVNVTSEGPFVSEFNVSPKVLSEGESVLLSGSITQDPPVSPLTLAINWGDGQTSTEPLAAGSGSFSLQHSYVDDDPTGTPADDYIISLSLSDEQGTFNTTAKVQVENVPPAVDAGPDRLVPAGLEIPFTAVISDPGLADTHSLIWDFGDGSADQSAAAVQHSFANPGEYTVTVTANDDDGGTGSDAIEVTVRSMIRCPIVIRS